MGETERRKLIFEVVENQLRNNDPPETRKTYERLRKKGFDDFQTKQMIGQCVAVQIFNALKHGKEADNDQYVKNLSELPKEPFD